MYKIIVSTAHSQALDNEDTQTWLRNKDPGTQCFST